ncbi:hypothetical protein D5X47_24265 [Salmonella enterica subsp. enterica serovar Typhimurium]|uniref:Uncharacterized protein n=1 Tax=Salmonella typhimurium TaxID=90371 RepID=A0A5X1PDM4_SALTM|nr:hypothetical protein [Salmonella enterica subsp. enterica serovar Typhimurium]
MYVFLGGRMYKKKGVGCTKKGGRMYELGGRMYDHWGGRMYVDNFMFQQLFYRVVHLIPNFTQREGAALTKNKKGPYGPIFLLP